MTRKRKRAIAGAIVLITASYNPHCGHLARLESFQFGNWTKGGAWGNHIRHGWKATVLLGRVSTVIERREFALSGEPGFTEEVPTS